MELTNCPWCDNAARLSVVTKSDYWHYVVCSGCEARGPMAKNNDKDEGQEAATDLWNLLADRVAQPLVIRADPVPCGCAEDQPTPVKPAKPPKPPKPESYHGVANSVVAWKSLERQPPKIVRPEIPEKERLRIVALVAACGPNVSNPEQVIAEMIEDARRRETCIDNALV